MKRNLTIGLLLAVVAAGAVGWSFAADQKAQKKKEAALAKFMRGKLTASNQILEGLVTENFDLVSKGAETLEKMSQAEQWRVSNDQIYRQFSEEFRRTAQQLKKDAATGKIDAASLTWIKTTMNCIECHKFTKGMLISQP